MTDYIKVDPTTGETYSQLNTQQDQQDTEWNMLVAAGQQAIETRESISWALGDIACEVADRWNRSKKTLIKFAGEIKMQNPRLIYEYHEVAEYFEKSARCELLDKCKFLSWSHFRQEYRYAKKAGIKLDQSVQRLRSCNDNQWSVEQYAEKNRKDPDGDWFTVRKRTPCKYISYQTFENASYMDIVIRVPKMDGQAILEARQHRNSIEYLGQRWEEQRIDKKK